MLGKSFKQKTVPEIDGNPASTKVQQLRSVKTFELELSNMEDAPVYELKQQLSIGSEIGNIVIADPSVSPRHATFIVQEGVVSVQDHGSIAGTFVNNQKITPGKYIILEDSDVVMVGELEIRLKAIVTAVPDEEIPEIPLAVEEIVRPTENKEARKAKSPVPFNPREHLKNNEKNKIQLVAMGSGTSTNALVRVFAVLSDLLLSYAILIIFLPFDDFRNFLDFVPQFIGSLMDQDWEAIIGVSFKEFEFLGLMVKDGFEFLSSIFHIVPLVTLFFLNRLLTTLLFGVTFSELCLGVRSLGNGLWARIGGGLRVLVGIVTGPFLIFDVPAILSRRTFKEVVTYTHTHVPSKFVSILGIQFFFSSMLIFAISAPLFQGLESPQSIAVNDTIEQRVKIKLPEAPLDQPIPVLAQNTSSVLNLDLQYDIAELTLIPKFKFQGVKSKLNLKSSLMFYQRDLQRHVEIEIFKKFDFKQLLGIGMKGNLFLYEKFPEIYTIVYESPNTNSAFKKSPKNMLNFSNEFIQFTKLAFSLSSENALEIMMTDTPLIKGLIDYKSSFLSLIEYKDFDQIGFMKLGNVYFMRISYNKQKPFDLIIPLLPGNGRIYKVSFDKKDDLGNVASKFYKFNLDKSDWLTSQLPRDTELMTPLDVFDTFSTQDFKKSFLTGPKAQAMYAYYFETSGAILTKGDSVEIELWFKELRNLYDLFNSLPSKPMVEGEEDPKAKLLQNFMDLIDALNLKNLEYFGISEPATV